MTEHQTTIKRAFTLSGPGLHTGQYIHATLQPAAADSGIRFRRIDLTPAAEIPAIADLVAGTDHGTTLAVRDATVSTIEHLMAALHGMRIDNVTIDIDGPEVPILDGSARLWVEQIEQVGIAELDAERCYSKLSEAVSWTDDAHGIELTAVPADDFQVTCAIDFESALIGTQMATLTRYDQFETEFAKCRTFVFLHEVEMLLDHNLIKGGALDNALVFVDKPLTEASRQRLGSLYGRDPESIHADHGVLNTIKPFFPNEPARHKLLDFMGDINLVGMPLKGHFFLRCPGHRANVALARKVRQLILQEKLTTLYDPNKPPVLDIMDIRNFMPHRYPMLLVDKIVSMTEDTIVGVKNVTANEPFFVGHFPNRPIMPGVLIIESMAQVGGLFAMRHIADPENYNTVLAHVQDARFRLPVVPGDTMIFKIHLEAPLRRGILKTKGEVFVGNKLVATAVLIASISKKQ